MQFIKHTFPKDRTLDGLRIVVDCANGAAYRAAPQVFEELGAEVTALAVDPDGRNINDGCGALHPEKAAAEVRRTKAAIGIALDGDADRVILTDERGEVVDGDHILAILGTRFIVAGQIAGQHRGGDGDVQPRSRARLGRQAGQVVAHGRRRSLRGRGDA